MTVVIDGLAVVGALNVATLFAFAVWVLTVQRRDRRAIRDLPPFVYSVDLSRSNLAADPVSGTAAEHTGDRAWLERP
jgi:hypothetical protein